MVGHVLRPGPVFLRATPEEPWAKPLPCDWSGLEDAAFARGFLMLRNNAAVLAYKRRIEAEAPRHQSFHCIYFTTNMNNTVERERCVADYRHKRADPYGAARPAQSGPWPCRLPRSCRDTPG